MKYFDIIYLNDEIDRNKLKQMNKKETKKYFKKVERKVKKKISKYESKDKKLFLFQLDQMKELEKMTDDCNVDEFKQIIYKEPSDIDVSKESIIFYSMFEDTIRTAYDFIYYAKHYLGFINSMLYFYRENFNFKCDYVNKVSKQEISIDVNNEGLQKYYNTFLERYFNDFEVYDFIGRYAFCVASEIVERYILDFVGLRPEVFKKIEQLIFIQSELETITKTTDMLMEDGFSIAKLTSDMFDLKDNGSVSNTRKDIFFDMENFQLIADNYSDTIDVKQED